MSKNNPLFNTRSSFNAVVVIFLFALLTTFAFKAVLPGKLGQDTPTDFNDFYFPVAQSIAQGDGIYLPSGKIGILVPPGYPIILAGVIHLSNFTGISIDLMLQIAHALLFALSAVVLYWAMRSIWGARAALITALLWACYPFSLWLAQGVNVEVPFFIFLFGATGLFFAAYQAKGRKKWLLYFLTGITIGLAMLIRPIAIGLGILLAVIAFFFETFRRHNANALAEQPASARRTGIRRISNGVLLALIVLAGNLLAVAGWEVWVYNQTGRVIALSSNGGGAVRDGLTFAVDTKGYRTAFSIPKGALEVMDLLNTRIPKRSPNSVVVAQLFTVFKEKPVQFTEFILLKVARSWYGTDSGRWENLNLIVQVPLIILLVAGFVLTIKNRYLPTIAWVTILACLLYFWAMTTMAVSMLRYMVPGIGVAFMVIPALLPVIRRIPLVHRLFVKLQPEKKTGGLV